MALSTDQQAQVEVMVAIQSQAESQRHLNSLELEAKRNEFEAKRGRLELIRLAKEVLVENNRSLPADSSGVTAEQIIEFANKLSSYVDV